VPKVLASRKMPDPSHQFWLYPLSLGKPKFCKRATFAPVHLQLGPQFVFFIAGKSDEG
jgi:hypothetical protein